MTEIPSDSIDIQLLEPAEVHRRHRAGALLVDVRTKDELAAGSIIGALHIDSREVAGRMGDLGRDLQREIIVFCRSGRRSENVAKLLKAAGYTAVYNGGGYDDLMAEK